MDSAATGLLANLSPNGSSNSMPSTPPLSAAEKLALEQEEAQAKTYRTALKVKMADHLRLMQDNQRILDTTTTVDRAVQDQRHRFRESRMASTGGLTFPKDSEMGSISIDSPVTTHNYPPAAVPPPPPPPVAPAPAAGMGTLGKVALGAALVAGGGGLGFLASQWAGRSETPPANTTNNTGFNLKFVEPEK